MPASALLPLDDDAGDWLEVLRNGGAIAVFTTTCGFCQETVPLWGTLAARLRHVGGGIIGIFLDEVESTKRFIRENDLAWPVVLLARDRIAGLRMSLVPVTASVAPDGRVLAVVTGALTPAQVDYLVETVTLARRSAVRRQAGGHERRR